ncbi:MAG: hypothetical protein ABF542_11620, partial [Gluconobacter sp.]
PGVSALPAAKLGTGSECFPNEYVGEDRGAFYSFDDLVSARPGFALSEEKQAQYRAHFRFHRAKIQEV